MDSRLQELEFRLLASVYSALGPDAAGAMRNYCRAVLIKFWFSGRYQGIADLMGPEATSDAVCCFLKRYVAPAANSLKLRTQKYHSPTLRFLNKSQDAVIISWQGHVKKTSQNLGRSPSAVCFA